MPWSDEEIDRRMGRLLKTGVLIAAAVMIAGGVVFLFNRWHETANYSEFHAKDTSLTAITEIFREAFHGKGASLIQVGTLLMIATPVARVAFAVYAFLRSHDRMYMIVSLIVLILLGYGLLFGS